MSDTGVVRAVIADDEPLARQQLRDFMADVSWLECVGEAATGGEAVRIIDAQQPDIVFLDIQMPEMTGVEVLEKIDHDPAVVFTTAHDRYAVAAFELGALDYLLKPFGRERFLGAVQRARRSLQSEADERPVERVRAALDSNRLMTRVFVRDRGRILPIPVEEIVRLEAEDDYVGLHARGRRFLVYLPLGEFEKRLDGERFLRVHRSHIVNLDHVSALVPYDGSRLQVEMRDGTKIMASRTRSRELRHLAI
ncbi:MAG TPA: LytTR family DNA-binding domain-containing protein [Gemmatimonadaceae bacterium]|nr:LytTR family DNA-binding domain-containing protein [Gemmatimonadaceae bacterium]